MKKIFTAFVAAILLLAAQISYATVGYPYPVTVTQPDGSTITIQMHGDEYFHWTTSEGQVVAMGSDGFYRPVLGGLSALQMNKAMATGGMKRTQMEKASSLITRGQNHFLVLLIAFDDLEFSISEPQDAFSNMLNQENYSANGATGSVHDYYYDNSSEVFDPIFDVVGPIKVSKGYQYYGEGDDNNVGKLLYEACVIADTELGVDFTRYDIDGNGVIDNIFFYYAGLNEAEGAGADYIWPHKWDLRSAYGTYQFDGKTVGTYACTSELKGRSGVNMCGIGTFCHEFGHTLGLPDFYDTDYEENGSGPGLYGFSLMSSGNYNNGGCTPPYLTSIERNILGWMDEAEEWTTTGTKTIEAIQNNVAYFTTTNNPGETFQYEVRNGQKWDAYVGEGLLIYHFDRSDNMVHGITAKNRWNNKNMFNCYGDHPCVYIKEADPTKSSMGYFTYPGLSGITAFDENSPSPAAGWDGIPTGKNLTDITYAGGKVTLTYGIASGKTVQGTVKDVNGNPIIGAKVEVEALAPITPTPSPVSGGPLKATSVGFRTLSKAPVASGNVGSDGAFSFDLSEEDATEFRLTVSCYGYNTWSQTFKLSVGTVTKDVVLLSLASQNEGETEYKRYSVSGNIDMRMGFGGTNVVAGIKYPASEIASAVGSRIENVKFAISGSSATKVCVVVDFGSDNVLLHEVTNPSFNQVVTVDISSYNLLIPTGKDVYVGVYVEDCDYTYPFWFSSTDTDNNGFYYRYIDSSTWNNISSNGSVAVAFTVKPVHSSSYNLGYNGIANPGQGEYAAGSSFALELVDSSATPSSVVWYLDDAVVTGDAVTLTAGEHVIKAVLTFSSGKVETIEQIVKAS